MVIEYALMRWARGEEEQAERGAIDRDLQAWNCWSLDNGQRGENVSSKEMLDNSNESESPNDESAPCSSHGYDDIPAACFRRAVIHRNNHEFQSTCPGCGEDVNRVALTTLVYVFERCDCEHATYQHLVERLWHARCFKAS